MSNKSLFLLLLFIPFFGQTQKLDSTEKAEAIAAKVLEACGGKERWENTRYFHWNFFGMRELWWDKQEHRVRIEAPRQKLVITADLDSMEGKAWMNGKPVKAKDSLELILRKAEQIWINDSYWLFMPFKMLDPGVELRLLATETRDFFGDSYKLEMTFDGVGVTPQNKYHVWVDEKEHLVRRWSYFAHRDKEESDMSTSWEGYEEYNGLMLASKRGSREITDISVPDSFPEGIFSELDPFSGE